MKQAAPIVIASLALLAGCRDEDPPPAPATPPAPTSSSEGPHRTAKLRPQAMRAIAPGVRRNLFATDAGAAAGPAADAADASAAAADASAPAPARTWSFDQEKAGEAPAGFELAVSAGKPGKWQVLADPGAATAPNVLAQLDADKTEGRFLTAVAAEPSLRDVRISARCKAVSGKVDQSCGVVARYKDAKNYYVARANALEKDVNLYVVKDGKRTLVGGAKGVTIGNGWHEIRLEAKGEHLEISWDGARVYAADDKTFPDAGRVGLWTKADSVTHFDEISVLAL